LLDSSGYGIVASPAWLGRRLGGRVREHRAAGLVPARVAIQHRGAYDVMHEQGEQRASAENRLVREEGLPAVGDWVGLDLTSN